MFYKLTYMFTTTHYTVLVCLNMGKVKCINVLSSRIVSIHFWNTYFRDQTNTY